MYSCDEVNAQSDSYVKQSNKAEPPRRLVIFTSESMVAHKHLDDLMPFFWQNNIKPVIFITPGCKSPRAAIPSLLRYEFYEASIAKDVIYPAIERKKLHPVSLAPTFNQLMKRYGSHAQHIDSLKDPAIMEAINHPDNIGAVSIYQDAIFKPDLINAIKEKGFLWNLHPAVLPENKGLYVLFWSLLQGKTEHGYTLHEIDAGIDTGGIISTSVGKLDKDKTVVESYLDFAEHGSNLLISALSKYMRGEEIKQQMQMHAEAQYYTFPTEDDIASAWKKGVRLWGTPEEMVGIYTRMFGYDKTVANQIRTAIYDIEADGQYDGEIHVAPHFAEKAVTKKDREQVPAFTLRADRSAMHQGARLRY